MKNYNKHLIEFNELIRKVGLTINISAQGGKNSSYEIFQRSRDIISFFEKNKKDFNKPEEQKYDSMSSDVNSQIQANPTQEKIWKWSEFIKEILRYSDTSLLEIKPSNFDGILLKYNENKIKISGTTVAIIGSKLETKTIEELLENSHFKFAIDSLIKKSANEVKGIEIDSNNVFVYGDNVKEYYDLNSFKETVITGVDNIIQIKKIDKIIQRRKSNLGVDSRDDLFDEAVEFVRNDGKASASFLQRRMRIGFARAARLLDIMEEKGIIGPAGGAEPREVYDDDFNIFQNIHLSDDGSPQRTGENVNPVIGVVELSKEIANILIGMNNNKGSVFGIFGRWGRGKTFLIDKIKREENIKERFEIVDFNAWKYQDTPASWAYLYEEFAKKYYEPSEEIKRIKYKFIVKILSCLDYIYKCFNINKEKFGLFTLLIFLISIALGIIWILIPLENKLSPFNFLIGIFGIGIIVILIKIIYIYSKYKKITLQIFKKYTQKQDYIKYLGLQHEIQKEIKTLLKVWFKNNNKKLLLVVEDIDRCPEERIIQIVDSLRVLLEDDDIYKKIVVVIAIDERILKMAIWHKYTKLEKNDKTIKIDEIISEYMDKLFLCGISLSGLTNDEKKEILLALTEDKLIMKNGETKMEKNQRTKTENTELNESSYDKKLFPEIKENKKIKVAKNQLTEKEFDAIIGIVNKIKNATPRRIDILIFRYLLARNIFKNKKIKYENDEIFSVMEYMENNTKKNNKKTKSEIEQVVEMVYYS